MKNPEIKLAKQAHAFGMNRKRFEALRTEAIDKVAKAERWRKAERNAAVALVLRAADTVYGTSKQPSATPSVVRAKVRTAPTPPKPLTKQERTERQAQRDEGAKTIRHMRASRGWSWRYVWEPKVVSIKQGDGSAHMMTRELLYKVFISPRGREYTHALPTEAADLLHVGVCDSLGVPPVRLIRVSRSLVVKRCARALNRAERIRQAREDA